MRRDEVEEAWKWVDSITGTGCRSGSAKTVSGGHEGPVASRGDDHP